MRKLIISFFVCALLLAAAIISGGLTFLQITTPANPASGSNKLYFKSDNKLYSLTSTGTETEIGAGGGAAAYDPTDPSWMYHHEEFMSLSANGTGAFTGQMVWWFKTFAGSGMGAAQVTPHESTLTDGPAHPGQWLISTGATSGTSFWVNLSGYDQQSRWIDASKTKWKVVWVFKLGATTQQTIQLGLMDGYATFAPDSDLTLLHDPTTTAGNFYFSAGIYGGTKATWETAVAADTNWHTFAMRGDDATASKVYMSLDGGTEHSFCASGCDTTATVTGRVLTSGLRMKTKEAADKTLYLDYYGAKFKVNATTGVR